MFYVLEYLRMLQLRLIATGCCGVLRVVEFALAQNEIPRKHNIKLGSLASPAPNRCDSILHSLSLYNIERENERQQ